MAQRGPGRFKAPDFLTFGTTRVVGRQPHAPAAFLEADLTPGHIVLSVSTRKIPVTDFDPGTTRLVAQCLNHCATPGPTGSPCFSHYCVFEAVGVNRKGVK